MTIVASDGIRKTNADTDATARSVNEVVLPSGWELSSSPDPVRVAGPMGYYEKRAEPSDGGFRVHSTFEVSQAVIPPEQYAKFAALLRTEAGSRTWW